MTTYTHSDRATPVPTSHKCGRLVTREAVFEEGRFGAHTRGTQPTLSQEVSRTGSTRKVALRPPVTLMKGRSWPRSPFRQLDAVTWGHLREKLPPAPMWEWKFCLEYSAGSRGASLAILKPVLPRGKNYNCHGNGDLELVVQKANHRARAQGPPRKQKGGASTVERTVLDKRMLWATKCFTHLVPFAPVKALTAHFTEQKTEAWEG